MNKKKHMRNKKNKFIIKNKFSKLERHQNLAEKMPIPEALDSIIMNYFNVLENKIMISYIYGENSPELINYENLGFIRRSESVFYETFKDNLNIYNSYIPIIDILSAYYIGEAETTYLKSELKDFILEDLDSLNREQIGYIFYKIVYKIYLSGFEIEERFDAENVNRKIMKKTLISNCIFNNKYKEIKRKYVVDSIIN